MKRKEICQKTYYKFASASFKQFVSCTVSEISTIAIEFESKCAVTDTQVTTDAYILNM